MRAAGISRVHGPVELLDLPDPRPLAGDEILIDVRAAGVANWDEIARTGGWDLGIAPPMALGVEAAGIVVEVGRGVKDFTAGDAVLTHPLPLRQQGAWAERLIAPADLIAHKPLDIPWSVAGAFPVPALTAEQVLSEAVQVRAGERVLVHGGAGVTGGLIVELAVVRGAVVIATAGPASTARVTRRGARRVVNSADSDWIQQVLDLSGGRGVDIAVNLVRNGAADALRCVADGGRLATITSDPPRAERGIRVATVYVRPDGRQLSELVGLLAAGRLTLPVASSYALSEAAVALSAALAGSHGRAITIARGDPLAEYACSS